jgi:hypothetical protein
VYQKTGWGGLDEKKRNLALLSKPSFFYNPHQETDKTQDYHTKHNPQPNGAGASDVQVVVDALSVHVVDDDVVHFVYLFRISFLYLNYNILVVICQVFFNLLFQTSTTLRSR